MADRELIFVSTGDFGQLGPADRRLIRSSCMRGKNTREGSRRSVRAVRAAERAVRGSIRPGDPVCASARNHQHITFARDSSGNTLSREPQLVEPDHYDPGDCEGTSFSPPKTPTVVSEPSYTSLPHIRPLFNDLACLSFADEMSKESKEIMFNLFTRGSLQVTFYPVEHYVDLPRSPDADTNMISWLLHDKPFLHSVLLVTAALRDRLLGRQPSQATRQHLHQALLHLNSVLFEDDSHTRDSILHVVLNLAVVAGIWGDTAATAAHLSGLQKIVRLRGGLNFTREHPKMHFKIDRLALSVSLSSGYITGFFTGPISWESSFENKSLAPNSTVGKDYPLIVTDSRLKTVFEDLKHLAWLINEHHSRNSRLDGFLFQDTLGSIQARLTGLQDRLDHAIDESLRLGMLAFLSTTFRVPGGNFPYPYLTKRLREACQNFPTSSDQLRDLLFWLLITGAITVFDTDEPLMRNLWVSLAAPQMNWEEARPRLQAVMWIGCLQDELGRAAIARLSN